MRRAITLLLITCAITLAGCGGSATAEPTIAEVVAVPTASPSPVSPTAAATVPATPAPRPTPTPYPTVTSATAVSPAVIDYIDEVLGHIIEHSIFKDRIDLETVRAAAIERAAGATVTDEAWDAVRYIVRQLNDPHSYFVEPGIDVANEVEDPHLKVPEGQRLEPDIGYVIVPEIRSGGDDRLRYVTAGIEQIRAIDEAPVCGWIIDLRTNRGGRGFTMLAAIGPILGDGDIGSYTNDSGVVATLAMLDGQVSFDGEVWTEGPLYTLQQPYPPVAVLYGRSTGSSGELVAIAFRGRPDSRSFGQPTAGAPTTPGAIELSDGAILVVSTARMTDRTGEAFDSRIPPDEIVSGGSVPRSPEFDPVVTSAVDWLRAHPACSSD